MVRREQLRLRRIFERLVLLSIGGPLGAVQACSSGSGGAGSPAVDDAGIDATMTGQDGGSTKEAAPDAGVADRDCTHSTAYYDDASYVVPDGSTTPANCYYFIDLPCGGDYTTGPSGASACYILLAECGDICSLGGFVDCRYWEGAGCADGSLTAQPGQPATVACGTCNGVGRRPAGLLPPRSRSLGASALGRYLAQAAHLEAASVLAFERLRDELRACGAPQELVQAAERSARDERRHTRAMGRLARRRGGDPEAPRVRGPRRRGLESLARENAVEGCVRETFGALVATWQAANAQDAAVRRAMGRIAVDEQRHAALAWAVAGWMEPRLPREAQTRVARARRCAVRALRRELEQELAPELVLDAGLPRPETARALFAAMMDAVLR